MAKDKRNSQHRQPQQRQAPQHDDPSVWRDVKGRNRRDDRGEYVTPIEDLRQMIADAKNSTKAQTDPDGTAKYIADLQAAIDAREGE